MSVLAPASRAASTPTNGLSATFAALLSIGTLEHAYERVIAELRALAVGIEDDPAGEPSGSARANLLARIPASPGPSAGGGPPDHVGSLLFCAHLGTVGRGDPFEGEAHPRGSNRSALGAQEAAAVAVLLALARHVCREGSPVDLELLFTVGGETALSGARALDAARLQSRFGFLFAHASPMGGVVVDSPTQFRVEAFFRGAAAHAGAHPEEGRSAILAASRAIASLQLGRVDDGSSVNVGMISGGTATSVVPECCSLLGEVRSIEDERAEALLGAIVDRIHEASNLPDCDCDVDVSVQRSFAGYRVPADSTALGVAEAALRSCGHEPVPIRSDGVSEANSLMAQGMQAINLASGIRVGDEADGGVSEQALEQMLDLALALLDATADLPQPVAL